MTKKSDDLGVLEELPLSDGWSHEASDFTPWLARPENLALLSEVIGGGLELEYVKKEKGIKDGGRIDILCKQIQDSKNEEDEHWVVIENQLENTDSDHLGRILTYIAGFSAVTIIWISAKIEDKHRSALDWLNKNTTESFRFFGLELKLYKIGKSSPAPKFNIISQPNNWEVGVLKKIQQVSNFNSIYWKEFIDYQERNNATIIPSKAVSIHLLYCLSMKKGTNLNAKIDTRGHENKRKIAIELRIHTGNKDKNKFIFKKLKNKKSFLKEKIGHTLLWDEKPDKIYSAILLEKQSDIKNENDWEKQFAWFNEKLESFTKFFEPCIREIDMAEFNDTNNTKNKNNEDE